MKKNFAKGISAVIAILMSASLLSGCGSKTESTQKDTTSTVSTQGESTTAQVPKDFVTLTVLYPGDESKRMESFLGDEFGKKIKEELNLGIEVNYSPWDQYWNKKDMMLASGENLDWYWEYSGYLPKVVSKKAYKPLNDIIDQNGSDLKKVIPEEQFKAFTFDGNLVAIPTAFAPTAEVFGSILVRQDLLEEVGMKELKSIADMDQFFEKAKAKYPEKKAISSGFTRVLTRELSDISVIFDGAEDSISINAETGKVESYYESDTFKKVASKMEAWRKMGYVPDDVTLKYKENLGRIESGAYLTCEGAISRPLENINNLRNNAPEGKLKEYLLSPDKSKYRFVACSNYIVVGPSTQHADRVVQFLNWIYKTKDNYLFTLYGVKDKDYSLENGKLKLLNTDALFYEWMFRNINYMEFPDNVDEDFVNTFKNWDKDAKIPACFGFAFDSTLVKTEEAKIISVIQEKFRPISTGFIEYTKAYVDAQKALKAAGFEKYLAEYQKQLDAYTASKK